MFGERGFRNWTTVKETAAGFVLNGIEEGTEDIGEGFEVEKWHWKALQKRSDKDVEM